MADRGQSECIGGRSIETACTGPASTRLPILAAIADHNRPFFDEFVALLEACGHASTHDFVHSPDGRQTIEHYFAWTPTNNLHDGRDKPYAARKAKWLFLGWLFRDAPEQRLKPLRKRFHDVDIMDALRISCAPIFPNEGSWSWWCFRDVMIDRLEGSYRALSGTGYEEIVRFSLRLWIRGRGLSIEVRKGQQTINGQTYDVIADGPRGRLLMPVKTRSTGGGGHANLYARDVAEGARVADTGDVYLLLIIAAVWSAKILEPHIHIPCDPTVVTPKMIVDALDQHAALICSIA